jgi:hypothetical protein
MIVVVSAGSVGATYCYALAQSGLADQYSGKGDRFAIKPTLFDLSI